MLAWARPALKRQEAELVAGSFGERGGQWHASAQDCDRVRIWRQKVPWRAGRETAARARGDRLAACPRPEQHETVSGELRRFTAGMRHSRGWLRNPLAFPVQLLTRALQ
jgi:hypothetical protein